MKKGAKIVIADDNADIRQTLKDVLAEKQYLVEAVNNGYELLIYLKKKSPQLVILDLMMPEKDGIEILSAIKEISPYTRIIIYTGFPKYKDSVYPNLADKFILKSETPEKLLQIIDELP